MLVRPASIVCLVAALALSFHVLPVGAAGTENIPENMEVAVRSDVKNAAFHSSYGFFRQFFDRLLGNPVARAKTSDGAGQIVILQSVTPSQACRVAPGKNTAPLAGDMEPDLARLAFWNAIPNIDKVRAGDILACTPCAAFPEGFVRQVRRVGTVKNGILFETVPALVLTVDGGAIATATKIEDTPHLESQVQEQGSAVILQGNP